MKFLVETVEGWVTLEQVVVLEAKLSFSSFRKVFYNFGANMANFNVSECSTASGGKEGMLVLMRSFKINMTIVVLIVIS